MEYRGPKPGRPGEHAFDQEDIDIVTLASRQIAFAINHVFEVEDMHTQLTRERERTESLVASDDLLRALSDVLDVRQVFPAFLKLQRRCFLTMR
jgi:hypothetical protein